MEQMQSEHTNEIFTALAMAQGEMSPAIKDSSNPFFKSKYSDLTSVWDAARAPLTKNGLCVVQSVMLTEGGSVLVTVLGHKSGQWIKSVAPIISTKNDAQGYGSAVTYQRRYAMSALCGVSSDDDDGEKAVARDEPRRSAKVEPIKKEEPPMTLSSTQASELEFLIGDDKDLMGRILKLYGNKKYLIEIDANNFDIIKSGLEKKYAK